MTIKREKVAHGTSGFDTTVKLVKKLGGVFSVVTEFGSYDTRDRGAADAVFKGAVSDLRSGVGTARRRS